MTPGIENSNNWCQRLYRETLKKDCNPETELKYKSYQNALNRLKHHAKWERYMSKCLEYKDNTRQLWQLINAHIEKHKHSGSIISYITVNGLKMYDPKSIANNFGKFYSELGENLASTIKPGPTSVNDYINKIPRNLNSVVII